MIGWQRLRLDEVLCQDDGGVDAAHYGVALHWGLVMDRMIWFLWGVFQTVALICMISALVAGGLYLVDQGTGLVTKSTGAWEKLDQVLNGR